MKKVVTFILGLAMSMAYSQDITFASAKEISETIAYINMLRCNKDSVIKYTGVTPKYAMANKVLIEDSSLNAIAKLRVKEIIENERLSHSTAYKEEMKGLGECIGKHYSSDVKDHITMYIEDKGLDWKGHRYALIHNKSIVYIGVAFGTYRDKSFSVILDQTPLKEGQWY